MLLFKIKKENKNDVPKKMWISYGITNFFAKNFAVSKLLSIFANRIMPIRASFLNLWSKYLRRYARLIAGNVGTFQHVIKDGMAVLTLRRGAVELHLITKVFPTTSSKRSG